MDDFWSGLIVRIFLMFVFLCVTAMYSKNAKFPMPHWSLGALVIIWYIYTDQNYSDAYLAAGFVCLDFLKPVYKLFVRLTNG